MKSHITSFRAWMKDHFLGSEGSKVTGMKKLWHIVSWNSIELSFRTKLSDPYFVPSTVPGPGDSKARCFLGPQGVLCQLRAGGLLVNSAVHVRYVQGTVGSSLLRRAREPGWFHEKLIPVEGQGAVTKRAGWGIVVQAGSRL